MSAKDIIITPELLTRYLLNELDEDMTARIDRAVRDDEELRAMLAVLKCAIEGDDFCYEGLQTEPGREIDVIVPISRSAAQGAGLNTVSGSRSTVICGLPLGERQEKSDPRGGQRDGPSERLGVSPLVAPPSRVCDDDHWGPTGGLTARRWLRTWRLRPRVFSHLPNALPRLLRHGGYRQKSPTSADALNIPEPADRVALLDKLPQNGLRSLHAVLNRVLDIADPADRAAFLDRECGPDPELRLRVDALLAAHSAPDECPASLESARRVASDTSFISISGYEVIEMLGSGTMGVVYKARETALKRLVALKLLRGNAHPDAVARFLIEAEAVASIDHPRVVRVFQYGEHNGRPFLAMEYLPGGTLSSRFGGRSFPPREAAVLVAKLAMAVGAAHARGIVHRDLKPSNVLFDYAGEPKVADFGLARRGAGSNQTRSDAAMGTPPYMPPEQFGGAKYAGPPADVWALGVILYECLTGTRPFQGDNQDELRDRIDRCEPAPPSRVAPEVPRDLELICLKCLAKAPSDRYPTAAVLADDLNRFLDWKPVSVRTFGCAERAVLWAHRNPMVAVLLATVVVSLVMGTTVSYLNYRDARTQEGIARANAEDAEREAREARRQEEIAISQGKRAEKARDRTREVLDAMTSGVTGDSLATQKTISPEQKKFLINVLEYYKEFAGEKGDDELSRMRTAGSAYRVGLIEARLGRKEEAVAAFRTAQEGFAALVADFPAVIVYRANLASSYNNLGNLLDDLGRPEEAEQQNRKAMAIKEKLVAEFPAVPEHRSSLASNYNNLGVLLRGVGKQEEAVEQYRKALAIFERLAAEFPIVPKYRADLASSYNNLGNLLDDLGRPEEAEQQNRKAMAIRGKLAAEFPAVPEYRFDLAASHNNLGILLDVLGKRTEAEQQHFKALSLWERLATEFPAVPEYRANLAMSYTNLGILHQRFEKQTEAEPRYRQALSLWERLATEFPTVPEYRANLAMSYTNLGILHQRFEKQTEAEPRYRQALAIQEKLVAEFTTIPEYRANLAESHYNLGVLLAGDQKWSEAEEQLRRALIVQEKLAAEFPEIPEYRQRVLSRQYNFACFCAIASGKIGDKKQEYADRAMEMLQKAVKAGFNNADLMAEDTNLAPLRDRADFKLLLESLLKPKKKGSILRDFDLTPPQRPHPAAAGGDAVTGGLLSGLFESQIPNSASPHTTTTTGSPRISGRGAIPSPGAVEADRRPLARCGAPSAILTVT